MKIGRERLKLTSQTRIAPGHYVMELAAPRLARAARPGQFVQIMTDDSFEPLLPRPFSFLDAKNGRIRILYNVVGKGTRLLSEKKRGDILNVLGPLGNGFSLKKNSVAREKILMVGGGVGIPPLFHLTAYFLRNRKLGYKPKDIHVFLGGRIKAFLHCEKDFKKMGVQMTVSTDDGSKGHKGVITGPLENYLKASPSVQVYACGPTPMLKAVSKLTRKYNVSCEVSVEEPMPCGFGVCLGCAIKVRKQEAGSRKQEEPFRYAMSCVEGPAFDSREILWD